MALQRKSLNSNQKEVQLRLEHQEIRSVRHPTNIDKLKNAIPPAVNVLPPNSLPAWKNHPLEKKFPHVPAPNNEFILGKNALGENIFVSDPCAGFDNDDPLMQATPKGYESLHDPHLKAYFMKHPRVFLKLREHGLVEEDGSVNTSAKDFNTYRAYLARLRNRCVDKDLHFQADLVAAQRDQLQKIVTQDKRVIREAKEAAKTKHLENLKREREKRELAGKLKELSFAVRGQEKEKEAALLAAKREAKREKVRARLAKYKRAERKRARRLILEFYCRQLYADMMRKARMEHKKVVREKDLESFIQAKREFQENKLKWLENLDEKAEAEKECAIRHRIRLYDTIEAGKVEKMKRKAMEEELKAERKVYLLKKYARRWLTIVKQQREYAKNYHDSVWRVRQKLVEMVQDLRNESGKVNFTSFIKGLMGLKKPDAIPVPEMSTETREIMNYILDLLIQSALDTYKKQYRPCEKAYDKLVNRRRILGVPDLTEDDFKEPEYKMREKVHVPFERPYFPCNHLCTRIGNERYKEDPCCKDEEGLYDEAKGLVDDEMDRLFPGLKGAKKEKKRRGDEASEGGSSGIAERLVNKSLKKGANQLICDDKTCPASPTTEESPTEDDGSSGLEKPGGKKTKGGASKSPKGGKSGTSAKSGDSDDVPGPSKSKHAGPGGAGKSPTKGKGEKGSKRPESGSKTRAEGQDGEGIDDDGVGYSDGEDSGEGEAEAEGVDDKQLKASKTGVGGKSSKKDSSKKPGGSEGDDAGGSDKLDNKQPDTTDNESAQTSTIGEDLVGTAVSKAVTNLECAEGDDECVEEGAGKGGLSDGAGKGGLSDGAGKGGLSDGAGKGGLSDGAGEGGLSDGAGEGGLSDGAGEGGLSDGAGEGGLSDGAGEGGLSDGGGEGGFSDGTGEGGLTDGEAEGVDDKQLKASKTGVGGKPSKKDSSKKPGGSEGDDAGGSDRLDHKQPDTTDNESAKTSTIGEDLVRTAVSNAVTNLECAQGDDECVEEGLHDGAGKGGLSDREREGGLSDSERAGGLTDGEREGGLTDGEREGGLSESEREGGLSESEREGGLSDSEREGGLSDGEREGGLSESEREGALSDDEAKRLDKGDDVEGIEKEGKFTDDESEEGGKIKDDVTKSARDVERPTGQGDISIIDDADSVVASSLVSDNDSAKSSSLGSDLVKTAVSKAIDDLKCPDGDDDELKGVSAEGEKEEKKSKGDDDASEGGSSGVAEKLVSKSIKKAASELICDDETGLPSATTEDDGSYGLEERPGAKKSKDDGSKGPKGGKSGTKPGDSSDDSVREDLVKTAVTNAINDLKCPDADDDESAKSSSVGEDLVKTAVSKAVNDMKCPDGDDDDLKGLFPEGAKKDKKSSGDNVSEGGSSGVAEELVSKSIRKITKQLICDDETGAPSKPSDSSDDSVRDDLVRTAVKNAINDLKCPDGDDDDLKGLFPERARKSKGDDVSEGGSSGIAEDLVRKSIKKITKQLICDDETGLPSATTEDDSSYGLEEKPGAKRTKDGATKGPKGGKSGGSTKPSDSSDDSVRDDLVKTAVTNAVNDLKCADGDDEEIKKLFPGFKGAKKEGDDASEGGSSGIAEELVGKSVKKAANQLSCDENAFPLSPTTVDDGS